jgi:hypothetical protein
MLKQLKGGDTNMTNENQQTTLDEYAEMFRKLKSRTGDSSAAAVILQEMARDARGEKARRERQAGKGIARDPIGDAPATRKQCDWLNDLGIRIPRDCTKVEASALIDQALAREAER